MEKHIVKIKSISPVTHDVNSYVVEKPEGYDFIPGQATEVSINHDEWKDETRPFTFTNLPEDDYLEFTIKSYTDHKGVTNKLLDLKAGDEFIIREVFGAINYENEGVFIAGGAGITPFVSIFRDLNKKDELGKNKLIFGNKTSKDIIYGGEFRNMLGENFINILSEEEKKGFKHGFVDEELLKQNNVDKARNVYLCGPPPMMDKVQELFEKFEIAEERIITEDLE
ncbi:MAG: FAD-binding oxidoreductase [Bacteroidota bacterium]